jgi:cell division protein FtsZ
VRGVTDLMVMPGLINLDFADIRTVMGEMGKAMMGTGEAEGQDRSRVAAESAISNPLLEDHSMKGAKGVLINITGGLDMTLHEVDEAANRIREEVDADANIIFGSTFDASMQGRMRVSVVATGIAAMASQQPAPNFLSLDMNRPMQTGQPALSRVAAPPVGRVAMPAAASAPAAPPVVPQVAPIAPPVAPVAAAAPAPVAPPIPVLIETPAAAPSVAAAPIEPMVAPAPAAPAVHVVAPAAAVAPPAPVAPPMAPVAPAPAPIAASAPVAAPPAPPVAPQRPLVDENDWRVSRPAAKPAVRATEPVSRPVPARAASDSRGPNLFQRITGAFAAPRPAAAPAEPPAPRPAPQNVVAVAPKPAPRPAPAQASIDLDVTERAKPARDDDDLQIPAFLRRQAN